MIYKGANVNAKGEYGNMPLHLACGNNHDGVVSMLLMVFNLFSFPPNPFFIS
jgi:ankyrin repeat protein